MNYEPDISSILSILKYKNTSTSYEDGDDCKATIINYEDMKIIIMVGTYDSSLNLFLTSKDIKTFDVTSRIVPIRFAAELQGVPIKEDSVADMSMNEKLAFYVEILNNYGLKYLKDMKGFELLAAFSKGYSLGYTEASSGK